MAKKVVNLNDFFTEENEEKGQWVRPEINGVQPDFELLITGANATKNAAAAERYNKKLAELEDIKDTEEKRSKKKDLDAERCADFVIGIRGVDGAELEMDGNTSEYSRPMIIKLFRQAPLIQGWVLNYAYSTTNFMTGKKTSSK